jgi:hypothetical protein
MCSLTGRRYGSQVPSTEADDHAFSRRPGVDRRLFGLLLVAIGILWLVQTTHAVPLSAETVFAVVLMLVGGGLLLTARRGRSLLLPVGLGVILTFALVGNSNSFRLPSIRGVGRQVIRPRAPELVQPEYRGSVGNLVLDLSQLPPAALDRQIAVHFGAGNLLVMVPAGTDVEVDSQLGAGTLTVCGVQVSEGLGIAQQYANHVVGAQYHLRLVITSGVGDVRVDGCQPEPKAAEPKAVESKP